jgi:hypothetical protein
LQRAGDRLRGTDIDLAGDPVAAGPIHTGRDDAPVACADHGIAFPIAQPGSFVALFRVFVNGSFARDPATAGTYDENALV